MRASCSSKRKCDKQFGTHTRNKFNGGANMGGSETGEIAILLHVKVQNCLIKSTHQGCETSSKIEKRYALEIELTLQCFSYQAY